MLSLGGTTVIDAVGLGLTTTVIVVSFIHRPLDTATVYVVLPKGGATKILCVVAPVLHWYEVPPLAVSVVALPTQIESCPLNVILGGVSTVTRFDNVSIPHGPLVT